MKNKILVWRLKEQPTAESLAILTQEGIITKDEAKDILLESRIMSDGDDGISKESLKEEIKFLRNLVEKISNKGQIMTTIREIEIPKYKEREWYQPYYIWCSSDGNESFTYSSGSQNFSSISTFN